MSNFSDPALLQRFLLGQLPSDQSEAIEAYLSQSGECSSVLDLLQEHSTLIDSIRQGKPTRTELDQVQIDRLVDILRTLPLPRRDPPISEDAGTQTFHNTNSSDSSAESSSEECDFLAPAESTDELGRLGDYRILKVFSSGGMGIVFRAEEMKLHRIVALKVMKPSLAASTSARDRFLREARLAASIEHDHIVPIYHVGEERGVPYLAMPLLRGKSLDTMLEGGRQLNPTQVMRLGKQVAQALGAAHERGLIHRDIKPSNLWLEPEQGGRIKVLDFGLARSVDDSAGLTGQGVIVGTPSYMAPEQARGESVGPRADLFSLGCVLYRMCTGDVPFQGVDTLSTLLALASQQPKPPGTINPNVPAGLEKLILSLLEKDAEARPESASAVVRELTRLERTPSSISPTSTNPVVIGYSVSMSPASIATETETFAPIADERSPRWRRGGWLLVGLALLALIPIGLYWGPAIVRYATNKGELVIEADQDVEVVLLQGGKQIRVLDVKGKRTFTITPGDYEIVVESSDGIRTEAKRFTLSRGGRTLFDARLVLAEAKMKSPAVEQSSVAKPPRTKNPLDDLRRDQISPYELTVAGFGDAKQAPEELVAILGHSNMKHWRQVRAVAFSPDDKTLASASDDGTVKLWNVETLQEKRTLWHDSRVLGVAYSPDGKSLVSSSLLGLRLWNPTTGEMLRETKGYYHGKVSFSPSGELVTAVKSNRIEVLFVPTWKKWKTLPVQESDNVTDFAIHPDETTLVTLSPDHSVIVWNLSEEKQVRSWKTPERPQYVRFSPDGEVLIVRVDYRLRMWDTNTWKEQTDRKIFDRSIDGPITFTKEGKLILALGPSGDVAIASYDFENDEKKVIVGGTTGHNAVCSSHDGRYVAVAHYDGRVQLFDSNTGENCFHPRGHEKGITAMTCDLGEKLLATGGNDKTVRLWEVRQPTPRVRAVLQGHPERITAVALSQKGQILASGDASGVVKLWDIAVGKETHTIQQSGTVRAFAFSPDEKQLAVSSFLTNGEVSLHDVATGKEIHTCTGHRGTVYALAYSPDGSFLASAGFDGQVKLWNPKTGKEQRSLPSQGASVLAIAIAPKGNLLVTSCDDGSANVWNLSDSKVVHQLRGHTKPVSSVAFAKDGEWILTGSQDGTVRVWESATGNELRQITSVGGVHSVTSSEQSPYFVTASLQDDVPRFWDTTTLEEKLRFSGHAHGDVAQQGWASIASDGKTCLSMISQEKVVRWDLLSGKESGSFLPGYLSGCTLHPDGKRLVCVGGGELAIVDVATGAKLKNYPSNSTYCADFSPDGTLLATGNSGNGQVLVWETENWTVLHEFNNKQGVNAVAISPDNKSLAVVLQHAPNSEGVAIWNLETERFQHRLRHAAGLPSLAFSPDSATLACGYYANYSAVASWWNVASGKLIRKTEGEYKIFVVSLSYSPDGTTLAAAYTDGHVRLWDTTTGKPVKSLKLGPSHGKVHHVNYWRDGRHLSVMNGNGTVYILRVAEASEARP